MNEGEVRQTTPPTRACAVCHLQLRPKTKSKKGVSDKNSPPGSGLQTGLRIGLAHLHPVVSKPVE